MPFKKGQSGNPRGRTPGKSNKKTAEFRDKINKAISQDERADLLAQLARGITVKTYDKRTEEAIVYTTPPDREAIRQLNEFDVGKPRQQMELSTKDDAPLPIMVMAMPPSKDKKDDAA